MCMNKRIQELRQSFGLSQEAFGERIGLKKSAVSLVENGKNGTTDQTIKSICREFRVREEWLRNGTGDMYEQAAPDDVDAFLKAKGITGVEADLFRAYMRLPKDLREAVIDCFTKYFEEKQATAQAKPPSGSVKDGAGNDG